MLSTSRYLTYRILRILIQPGSYAMYHRKKHAARICWHKEMHVLMVMVVDFDFSCRRRIIIQFMLYWLHSLSCKERQHGILASSKRNVGGLLCHRLHRCRLQTRFRVRRLWIEAGEEWKETFGCAWVQSHFTAFSRYTQQQCRQVMIYCVYNADEENSLGLCRLLS